MNKAEGSAAQPPPVSFRQAFAFWLRLGFISFGGPAGQITIMHQELVEKRRWISERRFLHALNYCVLLPALPWSATSAAGSRRKNSGRVAAMTRQEPYDVARRCVP